MNVILLDDDPGFLRRMKEMILEKYEDSHTVFAYSSYEALMDDTGKKEFPAPDVAILGVQSKEYDGILAAGILRRKFPAVQIVYFSGYPTVYGDRVFDYIKPYSFLLRPVDSRRLFRLLDDLSGKRESMTVHIAGKEFRIYLDSILYAVHMNRKLEIVTVSGNYCVYMKTDEFEAAVSDVFCRCHNSFVVNLQYVSRLEKNAFLMVNGERIDISRRYQKTAKEKFQLCHGSFR